MTLKKIIRNHKDEKIFLIKFFWKIFHGQLFAKYDGRL